MAALSSTAGTGLGTHRTGGENIDPADQRLSDITEQAMWAGIAALANARFIGQIGQAIDDFVTSQPGAELGILETTAATASVRRCTWPRMC